MEIRAPPSSGACCERFARGLRCWGLRCRTNGSSNRSTSQGPNQGCGVQFGPRILWFSLHAAVLAAVFFTETNLSKAFREWDPRLLVPFLVVAVVNIVLYLWVGCSDPGFIEVAETSHSAATVSHPTEPAGQKGFQCRSTSVVCQSSNPEHHQGPMDANVNDQGTEKIPPLRGVSLIFGGRSRRQSNVERLAAEKEGLLSRHLLLGSYSIDEDDWTSDHQGDLLPQLGRVCNSGNLVNNSQEDMPDGIKSSDSEDQIVYHQQQLCNRSVGTGKQCEFCSAWQPLRARHCQDCKLCVMRFDHHCTWVGRCIGQRNHALFWWFLLFQFSTIIWAIQALVFGLLYTDGDGLAGVRDRVIQWLALVPVVFCGFMVGCLVVFHTYLLVTNQTSIEVGARWKVDYLSRVPSNVAPFDKGVFRNLRDICCWHDTQSYVLPSFENLMAISHRRQTTWHCCS